MSIQSSNLSCTVVSGYDKADETASLAFSALIPNAMSSTIASVPCTRDGVKKLALGNENAVLSRSQV